MANIPGLPGYIQPSVRSEVNVISRGVSVPGGLRRLCIIGEGRREEVLVASAVGDGQDGDASCSPTGEASGRYFSLSLLPVSGRTEILKNGSLLRGKEEVISATRALDGAFDFRLDTTTGCIELQGASIGDQGGKKYSAASLNVGNGVIVDGTCGDNDLISVVDTNAPEERWTIRCVGVVRDGNGDPIPGKSTFTATGSFSGQVRDENGQPYFFTDSHYTGIAGAVSGTADECADGFVVASSDSFSVGDAVSKTGDATPSTTDEFEFSGDLITQGQAVVGDYLCIDGYTSHEIADISYDSGTDTTTLVLETDSLDTTIIDQPWEIRATNLFVDDPSVLHDGITGDPATAGSFSSSNVGQVLAICSGDSAGFYTITAVTSSRRLRVEKFQDPTLGFPTLQDDNSDGLAETGLTFHILDTNGILLFAIDPGTVPFAVGDKFFIDVNSQVLKEGDRLEARYIATTDYNDPELFTSPEELRLKHGTASLSNTLSLGAELAFENGAAEVLALQAKPALPRRTSDTLLEEEDSNGDGGFSACGGDAADCEADDLLFPIPLPAFGLGAGRPDVDTQVNIFVIRDGTETQIFPNKIGFYNPQFESETGQTDFITSSDYAFSYTIINTDTRVTGQGFNGTLSVADKTFSTLEVDFDAEDVGRVIVLQKVETTGGTVYTTQDDISTHVFGSSSVGVELVITAVNDDNTVTVQGNDGGSTAIVADAVDIQFFIKDISDTTNTAAALLLHSDLVDTGTMKEGDGIRISYIDERDADFFDANWFEAFEKLETADCQMVVPLPTQNRFGIFRAAVLHVENMSTIANQKERVAFIGAQQGVTAEALLGLEEVAVEDIGVLEGIQGDDPEEVLSGNTEDLVNLKLDDNYTSNRAVYFFPDQIVRNVQGTNTFIDGFYMAAAACGYLASQQNVALPLTFKDLVGFSILRDKIYRPSTLNQLGAVGATVVQPITGGGKVLAGRTTSQTGFVEDEEISIIFIRDEVSRTLRGGLQGFIGTVESDDTQAIIGSRVTGLMASLVSRNLVRFFKNIRVERDKVDPRQWNVFLQFQPIFPINYIYLDIEVGVLP